MSERLNVLNVLTAETTADPADPPGFRGAEARVAGRELGHAAGGRQLRVRLYDLPPGETLCPYHYEYVEEWLLLLTGELTLRTPSGSEPLTAGALVCFPLGPEGAHAVTTPAQAAMPARLLMFSDGHEPAVGVYPDSDKIGVYLPDTPPIMLRRRDGDVDYFEGETGG